MRICRVSLLRGSLVAVAGLCAAVVVASGSSAGVGSAGVHPAVVSSAGVSSAGVSSAGESAAGGRSASSGVGSSVGSRVAGARLAQVTVLHRDGTVTALRASSPAAAQALARTVQATDPTVLAAGAATTMRAMTMRAMADPAESRQVYLPVIAAPAAWASGAQGSGVVVAVVDSGVDRTHPDLAGQIVGGVDLSGDSLANGLDPHATHVAGIVAAARNGIDVVGVAPQARLLDVRVLDSTGGASSTTVTAGISWAVRNGAKIINLSLGGGDDPAMQAAIRDAVARGVLVVAAGGNEYDAGNAWSYPAAYPESIAVAAVDGAGQHASFSNTGSYIDISAPGTGIVSDYPGGLMTMSGTSMATPMVSGAAADLWGAHPSWTAAQIRAELLASALPLGGGSSPQEFGAGLVQAARQAPSSSPSASASATPTPTTSVTPSTSVTATVTPSTSVTPSISSGPVTPVLVGRVTLSGLGIVAYAHTATLSAHVSAGAAPVSGVTVSLQTRAVGTTLWQSAGTTTSAPDGWARFSPPLTRGADLRVITSATASVSAAGSNWLRVLMARPLTITAGVRGGSVVVRGATSPGPLATVTVQRYLPRSHSWVTAARATSTATGAYQVTLRAGHTRTALRAVLTGGPSWISTLSRTVPASLR